MKQLRKVTLLEFLDKDTRPTFVFHVDEARNAAEIKPFFCNAQLLSNQDLLHCIEGQSHATDSVVSWKFSYHTFRNWAVDDIRESWGGDNYYLFKGFIWKRVCLNENTIVVSGTEYGRLHASRPTSLDRSLPHKTSDDKISGTFTPVTDQGYRGRSEYHHRESSLPSPWSPTLRCYDWTVAEVNDLNPYLKSVKAVDWSSTPLGPMISWSPELRVMANCVMADPEPAVLFWGSQNSMLYNEEYLSMIRPSHPHCLGSNLLITLPQYSEIMVGVLESVRKQGKSVVMPQIPLTLTTEEGHPVDEYVRSRFHAVVTSPSYVTGVYQRITVITNELLVERRLGTLALLSEMTKRTGSIEEMITGIMSILEKNNLDFLAGAAYLVSTLHPGSPPVRGREKITTRNHLVLNGTFGLPEETSFAPKTLSYDDEGKGLVKLLHETYSSGGLSILSADDNTLPLDLVQDLQVYPKGPCRAVVIAPILSTRKAPAFGWLIFALTSMIVVDKKCRDFLTTIADITSTSIASLITREHGLTWEGQESTQQVSLSQRLRETELQVRQQETFFKHFVEQSSMGVFVISPNGQFIYRNRRFDDIHGTHDKYNYTIDKAIDDSVDIEYGPQCKEQFQSLFIEKNPLELECRLNKWWSPPEETTLLRSKEDEKASRVWIRVSAFPELGSTGEILQVLGCTTDVSALKWSVYVQERRAADALESKRRLETFIDTTNHELRNPLSAIILAGDDVITSVLDIEEQMGLRSCTRATMQSLLDNIKESGGTIVSCAKHQNRIVDDVLTASKLDSDLLEICPAVVNVESELRRCINMFQADAKEADVNVTLELSAAYQAFPCSTFKFDATRFLQVFINVLTNAIKFTRFSKKRNVHVELDISRRNPRGSTTLPVVRYVELGENYDDPTIKSEWGTGEMIFIIVKVTDTGRGLTSKEQATLFGRFSQASPKSHVTYGGSGLGLFISRRLTEFQGGGIGFYSESGIGSVFAFYIKARTTTEEPRDNTISPDVYLTRAVAPLGRATTCESDDQVFETAPKPGSVKKRLIRTVEGADHKKMPSVLVVEDNMLNQKVIVKQLQRSGCTVLVANHGKEALVQIEKSQWCQAGGQHISIVLLDWEMPIMDGLTCVSIIREMEREGKITGRIPVIGVTANVRPAQLKEARERGMDDIVGKPFRMLELMKSIWKLLGE